jgi:hypothetical protein
MSKRNLTDDLENGKSVVKLEQVVNLAEKMMASMHEHLNKGLKNQASSK